MEAEEPHLILGIKEVFPKEVIYKLESEVLVRFAGKGLQTE